MKKNIFNYTNTEINKLKRSELLELKYARDKCYFEHISGSDKNWSKKNTFEKFIKYHEGYTVKDLREELKLK